MLWNLSYKHVSTLITLLLVQTARVSRHDHGLHIYKRRKVESADYDELQQQTNIVPDAWRRTLMVALISFRALLGP